MGGVYFGVKFSENLFNFPFICGINSNTSIKAVPFNKIYSNTLFATNAQVDIT